MLKRFGRFLILAAIGFALGGGLAYFQAVQESKNAPVAEVITPGSGPISVPNIQDVIENNAEAKIEVDAPQLENAVKAAALPPPAGMAGSGVIDKYSLTDHNGVAVTGQSWPDKYKMVFFGFTHCPDICPTTLDKLTTVLGALGSDAEKVQTLFITTDPERDDQATMKEYVGKYHASILGLTGAEPDVANAISGYRVYAAKVPGGDDKNYSMDHSSFVFFQSPEGMLLDIFKKDDTAEMMTQRVQARMAAGQTFRTSTPPAAVPSKTAAPDEAQPAEVPAAEATQAEAPAETDPEPEASKAP